MDGKYTGLPVARFVYASHSGFSPFGCLVVWCCALGAALLCANPVLWPQQHGCHNNEYRFMCDVVQEVCEQISEEGLRLNAPKGCPPEMFVLALCCSCYDHDGFFYYPFTLNLLL
jgi:hypothetical protein